MPAILASSLLMLHASVAGAQPASKTPTPPSTADTDAPEALHATARLICEQTALVPGQIANLAVTFAIQKGWHLYWKGLSDSGMPIQIKPEALPAGYKWLPQIWPAPHRHEPAEGILDHIYEDQVTIIVPLLVPTDAKAGTRQEIVIKLDWLICKEACVFGKQTVSLTIPVADAAGQVGLSPDAGLVAGTRITSPILPGPGQTAPPPVTVQWAQDAATVRFPGATLLEFYPGPDSSRPSDLLADGRGEADSLTIRLHPKEGENNRLEGMLMARTAEKMMVYCWVSSAAGDSGLRQAKPGPGVGVPASK